MLDAVYTGYRDRKAIAICDAKQPNGKIAIAISIAIGGTAQSSPITDFSLPVSESTFDIACDTSGYSKLGFRSIALLSLSEFSDREDRVS